MKLSLPTNNFPFFKVISGSVFLMSSLYINIVPYVLMIALIIGKAHSIGAWFSMYISGKLNSKYVLSVLYISLVLSFWCFWIADSAQLVFFVSQIFFILHFFFDEFELQEEKKTLIKIFLVSVPTFLLCVFLISDFYALDINKNSILIISICLFFISIFFLKEINWFVIHVFIISSFIVMSLLFKYNASTILILFAGYHYIFWFIYPIKKLHHYNQKEKIGKLVNFLLFIVLFFLLFEIVNNHLSSGSLDFTLRLFSLGTMAHVLSTAPFGYFIGLPRPKYE